jgi:hypothetical protein
MYTIETSIVKFLHKSRRCWPVREQIRPRATSIDLVFIEKLEEDKAMEQHFVEAQTM